MSKGRIVVETAAGVSADTFGEVTFGTRTGCSVVVDDAIAAARHCAIEHDGGFFVRDLGSVSGTWVDGVRIGAPTPLRDGSQIVFGATRITARIEARDGAPTLVLALQRHGFWWRDARKETFDNDPDALVRHETGFGRFRALAAANRVALVAAGALALASALLSSVLEPLSDPGPLLPPHALATGAVAADAAVGAHARLQECRALADAQGCTVCHEPGGGVTEAKCRQCHGDLAAPTSKRHPYLGDGDLAPATCVECHTDHQGMVAGGLKPGAGDKTGKCEACHGDAPVRAQAAAMAPPPVAPPRSVPVAAYRFPHKSHADIACDVCHQVDPARVAARAQGLPDDPLARDFAAIPYEACRSCHVADSPAVGIPAAAQERHRAKDKTWTVAWHGTDDGGAACRRCHVEGDAKGRFGPPLRPIPRPDADAAGYAAERARYTVPARRHEEQFAEHAMGKDCRECHKADMVTPRDALAPRTFWHALHLAPAAMQPDGAVAGALSRDAETGCSSCHQGLLAAGGLTDARTASYHWPQSPAEANACGSCHRDGQGPLAMAAATTAAPARTALAVDFPHDVHLAAAGFGREGALAAGCYACHEFVRDGADAHRFVPRTLPAAADCSKCHTGHANIGGNSCQQCHPHDEQRTSNSFLVSAAVADGTVLRGRPATRAPVRSWPGANGFSHLSPGHDVRSLDGRPGLACAECHDEAGTDAALQVADVPVPVESQTERACRICHLREQFHWR